MGASWRRVFRVVCLLLVVHLGAVSVRGQETDPNDPEPIPWVNRYVFEPEQSTILQTGGFAGVHWTYVVEGQFILEVDPNAGIASFAHIDANAVDETEPLRILDPNDAFNLMGLSGTVVDDTTIEFAGQAANETTVRLRLTFRDDNVHLTGETIPPPNSADFFILTLDAIAERKYAGGTGEPNHPYQIATPEQMNQIGLHEEDWDKHFQLTADIDLGLFDGQEGRPAFNIIAPDLDPNSWDFQGVSFTGVFDGDDCTILNLSHECNDSFLAGGLTAIGLFGSVADPNAEIRNVRLADPNIDAPTAWNVGALVGWLVDGTVDNCAVDGGVVSGSTFVGGLIGQIGSHSSGESFAIAAVTDSSSIARVIGRDVVGGLAGGNFGDVVRCFARVDVGGIRWVGGLLGCNKRGSVIECHSTGHVVGVRGVGGLFGTAGTCNCLCISGSVAWDCYSNASVQGDSLVGGLIGSHTWGWLRRCYSYGEVTGVESVGGLIGAIDIKRTGSAAASFWDTETSGQSVSAAGTGLTTTEMQTADTFLGVGWDFVGETENGTEDIWWIDEGRDYPRLWWENAGVEF